jgi:hypothetical protein
LNSRALREVFTEENTNSTSRILALRHDESGEIILLTGDSTPVELKSAMVALKNLNRHYGVPHRKFSCIKVSHHGAKTCHVEEIYESHCDADNSIAIICAADDGSHPHPEVTLHISKFVQDCRITGKGDPATKKPERRRGVAYGHKRNKEIFEDIHVILQGAKVAVVGGHGSYSETL